MLNNLIGASYVLWSLEGSMPMSSFKQKKDIENSAFPIEMIVRDIRDDNKATLSRVFWELGAIIFSGFGTTLLLQEDYLPKLTKTFLPNNTPSWFVYIVELVIAVLLFALFSICLCLVIRKIYSANDNKGTNEKRRNLAEYFHKIILNNIITGVSFEKRAWKKRRQYEDAPDDSESKEYYWREIRLYICEAIYYLKVANDQIKDNQIFEAGNRDEYKSFIKKIGKGTLRTVLAIYMQTYDNLKDLNQFAGLIENEEDLNCIKKDLDTMNVKIANISRNNKNN